jgi:hypothetical protein
MATTSTHHRVIGQITRGIFKGALVRPCTDSMECPFFFGADGKEVAICYITEGMDRGMIVALKSTEMKWL